MKKKKLEIMLQRVRRFENPKAHLEQYFTPASIAADILFLAFSQGDIYGKSLADLGSGTGIFSIGACVLGAKKVYSVEIDPEAVKILEENLKDFGCENVEIVGTDIKYFTGSVDTVIQNPPFGSQNRHADLPFLLKALEIGRVIYTLHNSETREFITRTVQEVDGKITMTREYEFPIPHQFHFHREEIRFHRVTLFRVEME